MSDKKKALITIIVAIYNGEKYLQECLESILHQDYKNLEILLVDDGSTDSSGKIADEYAKHDKRIKVIHQRNAGVSIARNHALENAHGEYVCIIDQDDCISPDYVSYFYHLICDYEAEIACTPSADKFKDKIGEKVIKDRIYVCSGEQAAEKMLYHKFVIAPWNKMIDSQLIRKNSVCFQPEFFGGEGFAFSIECFQQAQRVAVGRRKIYHYRVGNTESGASKFRLSTINSSIEAQQYIKTILKNKTQAYLKAWQFSNWHTHCDCFNMMVGCRATQKYRKEYDMLKGICKKMPCVL